MKNGKTPAVGHMDIEFCSIRCMRRFLDEVVDELDRRIEARRETPAAKRKEKTAPGRARNERKATPATRALRQISVPLTARFSTERAGVTVSRGGAPGRRPSP